MAFRKLPQDGIHGWIRERSSHHITNPSTESTFQSRCWKCPPGHALSIPFSSFFVASRHSCARFRILRQLFLMTSGVSLDAASSTFALISRMSSGCTNALSTLHSSLTIFWQCAQYLESVQQSHSGSQYSTASL